MQTTIDSEPAFSCHAASNGRDGRQCKQKNASTQQRSCYSQNRQARQSCSAVKIMGNQAAKSRRKQGKRYWPHAAGRNTATFPMGSVAHLLLTIERLPTLFLLTERSSLVSFTRG